MSHDFADLVAALPASSDPQAAARIAALQARLRGDQDHYDHGPDGRQATAAHARDLEQERDTALARAHAFDNAAAALELGIVLATASVIVGARGLLWLGGGLGLIGLVFAGFALWAPSLGAL
jgi:hypothetical protein